MNIKLFKNRSTHPPPYERNYLGKQNFFLFPSTKIQEVIHCVKILKISVIGNRTVKHYSLMRLFAK